MPNPETIRTCANCGTILPAGQLCFACALALIAAPEPMERASARFDPAALPCAFGAYEVRREIAVGGMGAVYEAFDPRLGRTVAVKMMRSLLLATTEEKARFKTQAGAAAQLDHPNIVPVYEVGEQDGQPFFTMKLIEGGSLADRLRAGALPPREAAALMAKVARAVQQAHERGVLHRDLKPGNVVLDAAGEPWLTDFGLAKVTTADSGLTLSQSFLGTPEYMSPEQAAGRTRDIGPASDVWALGAMLFQLLTGRLPFSGEGHAEVLRRIISEEPQSITLPVSGSRALVHRDLQTIMLRCLAKDKARRISSAAFFADELERWLAGEPIHSRAITGAERAARWVRRHPWPVVVAALLVAVLALVIPMTRAPIAQVVRTYAPAPPFQNGSFEANAGNRSYVAAGWTFSGPPKAVGVEDTEGASAGSYAVLFNRHVRKPGGGLWQTFRTVAGQTYTVQFDFGTFGWTSVSLQTVQVQVRDGDSPSSGSQLIVPGSAQIDATSGGLLESHGGYFDVSDGSAANAPSLEFNKVTFTFTARSSTSTLVFTDVSIGNIDSQDGVLDNVTVK